MPFTITIETDNAAFGESSQDRREEVARILHIVAGKLTSGQDDGSTFDGNGNRVGSFELEQPDDENEEE